MMLIMNTERPPTRLKQYRVNKALILAGLAECDHRTALKYLKGDSLRPLAAERIENLLDYLRKCSDAWLQDFGKTVEYLREYPVDGEESK